MAKKNTLSFCYPPDPVFLWFYTGNGIAGLRLLHNGIYPHASAHTTIHRIGFARQFDR
jgi:hypothetical protein